MNYRTLKPRAQSLRLVALASIATLTISATAQVAPSEVDDETIQLNPFTVQGEQDFGYRSTMAATASGSGLAIKDTPLAISIINAEFLADKNITDVREALRYVPGLIASTNKEERDIYSRGFKPIIKVDGAETGGAVISASFADRIEVVKGPVSVLQGVASAGGVVNIMSRRPTWNPATQLELAYGSYDYKRALFSASGPLIENKLAYRAAVSRVDAGGWVDNTGKLDEDYQVAFEFKPTSNVSLLIDIQNTNRHESPHQHLAFTHPDFLAAELATQAAYDANGLDRPADAPQYGERAATWLARKGYPADTPTEVVDVTKIVYPNGYEANIQGPDAFRDLESTRLFAEANVQINEAWHFRSLFADYETERYSSAISTFRPSAGWSQTDLPNNQHGLSEGTTFTNELVGGFEFAGMKHRVLFGHQYRDEASDVNQIRPNPQAPYDTINGATRHIMSEILADNPDGIPPLTLNGGSVTSYYFIDQITAMDDRLHTLFGGRYSKSEQEGLDSAQFTPQLGAVFALNEWASVFAGYGESFRPNFTVDGNGNIVDPTEETNFEYGLKFSTTDGKFSGTVSIFDMEQKNVALRDFAAEAITGISPLFNVSGLAVSAGAELEFIYAPMRNYQMVVSYANNWDAKTVVAQDQRQVGVRLQGAVDEQFSFWNKYTFVDGNLDGLYIGAGMQYTGAIHLHPSWSAPIFSPEVWIADATIGYRFKMGETDTDFALRVNNLTDEFSYDQTFRPAFPRTVQLIARFKF